jgi:hypothetical protein
MLRRITRRMERGLIHMTLVDLRLSLPAPWCTLPGPRSQLLSSQPPAYPPGRPSRGGASANPPAPSPEPPRVDPSPLPYPRAAVAVTVCARPSAFGESWQSRHTWGQTPGDQSGPRRLPHLQEFDTMVGEAVSRMGAILLLMGSDVR